MKKVTSDTLNRIQVAEQKGVYVSIDFEDKTGKQKARCYSTELANGDIWYVDETKGEAVNLNDGNVLDIPSFMLFMKKTNNKDNSFTADFQVLENDELNAIAEDIKKSHYLSEVVRTNHETKEGIITATHKIIIAKDEHNEPFIIKAEIEKRTSEGADLLMFTEPKIYLAHGLTNSMLYYTDDRDTVLHFLGFEPMSFGKWYNPSLEIIAHVGEYNYFKRVQKVTPVATKSQKARSSLLSL